MTVALGVTLPQFTDDRDRLVEAALRAEAAGLDSIWLFDHMWPLSGDKERPILEQWTTLAYIAAETQRITVGTLVTRSSVRHPALLAKMAATVASVAPGRLVVTLGSGDSLNRAENEAFGLPYFSGDDRTIQLSSTAAAVRSLLSGRTLTAMDEFTSIHELPPSPTPETRPRLWIGGNSTAAYEAARREGDGWNAWGKDADWYGARLERDLPDGFEPSWGGLAHLELDRGDRADDPGGSHVSGPPEMFAETLRGLVAAGARHLIVSFRRATPETFEAVATTVRPLLD